LQGKAAKKGKSTAGGEDNDSGEDEKPVIDLLRYDCQRERSQVTPALE
jgi:hypothetical protein